MDNAEFERNLIECKETLDRLFRESKEVSEKLCKLLEEHDGESGEVYWSCRTMNTSVDDVLEDAVRRIRRLQEGDKPELPQVLILAIECCERLQDTAVLCREGRQGERRDLKGQISSNLGYLVHHLDSMMEDEYLPADAPSFTDLREIVEKVMSDTAEIEELVKFICENLDPVHTYLENLRRDSFWEEE